MTRHSRRRGPGAPPAAAHPPGARLAPLLLGVALLALYAGTLCPTVGPGDSGELSVALCTWGVPHAPGYPLLSLLGNLVTHAVRTPDPAWVLNLLNAACAAAACGVLAAATGTVTGSVAAGLVAGLALGTSRVFWLHALALEVFSLNALMAALLLWLLARFASRAGAPRPAWGALPAAVLVMTTALTHHLTLALLAVPAAVALAVLAVRSAGRAPGGTPRGRLGWLLAAALAVGLLPLLYIPIAARFEPPHSWGDVRAWSDLIRLLGRLDFGSGTLLPPPIVVDQVLRYGERASPLGQRNLLALWADVPRSFGWAFPVLALIGAAWTARRARAVGLTALGFLVLLTAFFARVNTPRLPLYAGVTERFYILPHVVLALLAGCGVAALGELAARARLPRVLVGVLAAAVTGVAMIPLQAGHVSQRSNTFTRDFGANLLAGMPRGSLFFATGDLFYNGALYQQYGLGHRRDVGVVEQDLLPLPWYARQLRRRGVLRLPPAASPPDGDTAVPSAVWLALNGDPALPRPRPVTAVRFVDDTYRERWQLVPLGLASLVRPREETWDLAERERACASIARSWELAAVGRGYSDESWEATEDVFYPNALGRLMGMRDVLSLGGIGPADTAEVPALATAARWTGRLRAELLAQRADFIRACLDEGRGIGSPEAAARLASHATALAESALTLAPDDLQALQALAGLRATRRGPGDLRAEFALRQRIVELRPGDVDELVPYFALARRLGGDPAIRDTAVTRMASQARARLLRLFGICERLAPAAGFAEIARRWEAGTSWLP